MHGTMEIPIALADSYFEQYLKSLWDDSRFRQNTWTNPKNSGREAKEINEQRQPNMTKYIEIAVALSKQKQEQDVSYKYTQI